MGGMGGMGGLEVVVVGREVERVCVGGVCVVVCV